MGNALIYLGLFWLGQATVYCNQINYNPWGFWFNMTFSLVALTLGVIYDDRKRGK